MTILLIDWQNVREILCVGGLQKRVLRWDHLLDQ